MFGVDLIPEVAIAVRPVARGDVRAYVLSRERGGRAMTEMLEKGAVTSTRAKHLAWQSRAELALLTRTRCDPVDGSYVGHCTGTACALGLLGPAVDAGGEVRPLMLLICNEDHITSKPRARNSQCDPSHTNIRVSRGGEVCPVGCRLAGKRMNGEHKQCRNMLILVRHAATTRRTTSASAGSSLSESSDRS